MSGYLLDVNVLVALAWPEHSANEKASAWFERHGSQAWATCPMTEAALVRLLSNPAFSNNSLSPMEAVQVLKRNIELPGHHFWSDSITLMEALEVLASPLTGHQQVTDAYLVALALRNKGKVATLDRGLAQLAPAGSVEVIG